MSEVPCGFHAATKHSLKLAGRNSFLAGAHQVDDLEPEMQGQMAAFKDGPHTHGKGLTAGVALVQADPGGLALHGAGLAQNAAMGAGTAIGPKVGLHIGESRFLGLEMGGIQDGLGHGRGFRDYPVNLAFGAGYVKCNIAIMIRYHDTVQEKPCYFHHFC